MGGGAGEAGMARDGGKKENPGVEVFLPRGSHRICYDALKPRCSKH